jgi:hypothetical protein
LPPFFFFGFFFLGRPTVDPYVPLPFGIILSLSEGV